MGIRSFDINPRLYRGGLAVLAALGRVVLSTLSRVVPTAHFSTALLS